jgi:CRP-like cAMP-binding protein
MLEESQAAGKKPAATIHVPVTTSDVAEFVSTRSGEVLRAMEDLERQGIIKRVRGLDVRVTDRARFETMAGR